MIYLIYMTEAFLTTRDLPVITDQQVDEIAHEFKQLTDSGAINAIYLTEVHDHRITFGSSTFWRFKFSRGLYLDPQKQSPVCSANEGLWSVALMRNHYSYSSAQFIVNGKILSGAPVEIPIKDEGHNTGLVNVVDKSGQELIMVTGYPILGYNQDKSSLLQMSRWLPDSIYSSIKPLTDIWPAPITPLIRHSRLPKTAFASINIPTVYIPEMPDLNSYRAEGFRSGIITSLIRFSGTKKILEQALTR